MCEKGHSFTGVGKSSLVNLISHQVPIKTPYWTVGCAIEVKLHEYKEGTPSQKTYFLELWDIGGSSSHENSRAVFYNAFHAPESSYRGKDKIMAFYYYKDLQKQLEERKVVAYVYEYDPEQFVDNQIPILVIGTKQDLVPQVLTSERISRISSVAEECGADEITVDNHQAKSFAPGSSNAVKLSRFFDKVIERRYHSQSGGQLSAALDRRRNYAFQTKLIHTD
ncbi:rab-like protein 3 [Centruroides sculpturatus]|uniref:rab-like protein 3 n=1 Tax=Centruroides sculpturatus TaxID=218467 RepID=UPI000C6CF86C|nr:rab-like protein 3 [Centruroides sculpturatus]